MLEHLVTGPNRHLAGGVGGLLQGWLLAFRYHRHGTSDRGDAPVYVALGLTSVGAGLGAIAGFISGIIYSVQLAERHHGSPSMRIA